MSKNWSSKSLGTRFQHSIFYSAIALAGWPFAYFLLFFTVFWYSLCPSIQRRSHPYLQKRFPHASSFRLWLHTLQLYWEFGKVLVDRARAGILGKNAVTGLPQHEQQLRSIIDEGKGVILLSAHFGCWQLALAALSKLCTIPTHVAMYKDIADNDKHFFEHHGQATSFSVIDPQGGVDSSLAMLQALQKGHVLGFLGDRLFGASKHAISVPLLNKNIRIPCTPFLLAAATGAPIVIWFAHRTGVGTGNLQIAKVLRIPQGATKQVQQQYAVQYAKSLEECIMQHPYQLFNFFNMWE